MNQDVQIEIPLSKSKMTLTLMGSIAIVVLGLWFLINPPKIDSPLFGNPTVTFIVGLACVIFFGFVGLIVVRKLSEKKPGLIVSKDGIIDNSSGVSAGLILWTDITEIRVARVISQKFLMLIVRNPQEYLDKISNPFKRKTMEMNFRSYGSPISISANSLQTNFDSLEKLLKEKLIEFKS